MTEIRFEVEGLPPAKSETKSMLGRSHKHASRVLTLLNAAREKMASSHFEGFGTRRLRLEVEVYSSPEQEPWDATNYLGGIADVLEAKARRLTNPQGLSLEHLGNLLTVGLYEDDRQIKEISYREVVSESTRYVITLSALEAWPNHGGERFAQGWTRVASATDKLSEVEEGYPQAQEPPKSRPTMLARLLVARGPGYPPVPHTTGNRGGRISPRQGRRMEGSGERRGI